MKRIIHLLLIMTLLCMTVATNAQVRVGGNTAPNSSAMLDLNPDDGDNAVRGLALPRVKLVSTTNSAPLAAHVAGMLVFNTVTANDVKPGVYYNNGTKWIASGQSVSEEIINDILSKFNVASADNTVAVTGSGTNDIDLSVNVKEVANELSKYIANTILGDEILNYIIDNLDESKFGTIIQQYITNDYSNIVTYITNNFPPELNDKILDYITNNVTQELTNKIMAKVKIASEDKTVTVTGSGTSNIDLSVDIDVVGESLVNNNTFVTELTNNNTFKKEVTNNILYDDTNLRNLIDSVAELIKNNDDTKLIEQIVNQITNNENYINQFGDEIQKYITKNFSKELGDEILNYFMENVNIASSDKSIAVEQDGNNIDLTVNIDVVGEGLVNNNTFVTELTNNNTFKKEVTNNILYDDTTLRNLIDSIASLINEGDNGKLIEEIVNQITKNFPPKFGDEIINYISNNFTEELGSTILNYITENVSEELVQNIMAKVNIASKNNTVKVEGSGTPDIDLSVDIDVIGDSLVHNDNFVTNLVTNETFVTELTNNENFVTELTNNNTFKKEVTNNILYDDTYLKNLIDSIASLINEGDNGKLVEEIVNQIIKNFPPKFGDEIINYISNNFTEELGNTILNYITENVSEELVQNIMSKVNIASKNNTVKVEGSGTPDIDLSVDIDVIGDSLVHNDTFVTNLVTNETFVTELTNNETFVTDLVNNNTFKKEVTNNILYDDTYLKNLIDSIASLINEGDNGKLVEEIVNQIIKNFPPKFGDEIINYISNNFTEELGNTILNYITENVSEELVQNIMSKVSIASEDNSVIVKGSGTSNIDLSVNIKNVGDSLASNINNTSLKDTIINLAKENSTKVKTLEISLNEVIGMQSKTFFGTTATASSTIKIVGIEPQLTGDPVMLGALLKVNALANLNSDATAINWSIAIENDNINSALSCTLEKVIISYICNEDLSGTKSGIYSIAGR